MAVACTYLWWFVAPFAVPAVLAGYALLWARLSSAPPAHPVALARGAGALPSATAPAVVLEHPSGSPPDQLVAVEPPAERSSTRGFGAEQPHVTVEENRQVEIPIGEEGGPA